MPGIREKIEKSYYAKVNQQAELDQVVRSKEFIENLRDRRILLSALVFGPVLGPLMLAALLQLSVSRNCPTVNAVSGFSRLTANSSSPMGTL